MATMRRAPGGSSLYDVLELILDRGLVIDAYVRVSLVGIELLTVDAHVVVASVDTFIRYAEAMERLGWRERERNAPTRLGDMVGDGVSGMAIERGKERVKNAVTGNGRRGRDTLENVASSARNVISQGASMLKEGGARRRRDEDDQGSERARAERSSENAQDGDDDRGSEEW